MPAAAVIPAPKAYAKVVAVKKLVVGSQSIFFEGFLVRFVLLTECALVLLLFFWLAASKRMVWDKEKLFSLRWQHRMRNNLRTCPFKSFEMVPRSSDKTFADALH